MKYDKRAAAIGAGLAGLAAGCASGHMVIMDKEGSLHYFTRSSGGSPVKDDLLAVHNYVPERKVRDLEYQVMHQKADIGNLKVKLQKETAEKTFAVETVNGMYNDLTALRGKDNQYSLTDILGISAAVVLGTALISVLANKLVKKYISR